MVNLDPVERDLAYLTGPEAAGRLSGTEGARKAADYLAEVLRRQGLAPAGEGGFFQRVDVPAARLMGPARLVVDGKSYRHRREFGAMAHLSAGAALRAPLAVVRDGEESSPAALQGKVILIPERPEGFDLNATAAAAAELGAAALLVEWGEPGWFHKTLFGSAESRIPVIRIRRSLAAELAARAGAPVELDLSLQVGTLPCNNVLGLLPGQEPTRTVALTAHYDHVGDDPGGERFPGAADNASGVVTLLEVLRDWTESGRRPPVNLLVAFLTGEESGLWGARHLTANLPMELEAVINLDGMGLEPGLRAIRLGYDRPGNWLADLAAAHFAERGTTVQWIAGGDDSRAFQAAGLAALGLGQQPTQDLTWSIHTPADTAEVLHLPTLSRGAEAIVSLIRRLASRPARTPITQEV